MSGYQAICGCTLYGRWIVIKIVTDDVAKNQSEFNRKSNYSEGKPQKY